MATTSPPLIKTCRILNIVDPLRKPAVPGLMGLPRELRDVIWTMVFRELDLPDRKHTSTCQLGGLNSDYMTPPAVMRCLSPATFCGRPVLATQAEDACRRTCVRRKSLGLLRVSKQVHAEAVDAWSKQDIHICFFSSNEMLDTILNLPRPTRQRIRSLTVYDYLPFTSISLYDRRDEYFDTVSSLENLQRIDISPSLVRGGPYWMVKLAQMPKLQKVVLSMPPEDIFAWNRYSVPEWRSGRSTFATISYVIDIDEKIPCAHNMCARGSNPARMPLGKRVTTEYWCSECTNSLENVRQRAKSMEALADSAWGMRERGVPDLYTALKRLRQEAPTHSKEHPIVGSMDINGQTYQTRLWGIPEDPPKVRRRREAKMRIASIPMRRTEIPQDSGLALKDTTNTGNAHKVKTAETRCKADRRVSIKVEGAEPYTKAFGRLRTRVEVRMDEAAQINAAEARNGRNSNTEMREQKQKRLASDAHALHRQKLKREADDERKAVRKRVLRA